jgi:hypothetical protein
MLRMNYQFLFGLPSHVFSSKFGVVEHTAPILVSARGWTDTKTQAIADSGDIFDATILFTPIL